MFEQTETACFEPNMNALPAEDGFSQTTFTPPELLDEDHHNPISQSLNHIFNPNSQEIDSTMGIRPDLQDYHMGNYPNDPTWENPHGNLNEMGFGVYVDQGLDPSAQDPDPEMGQLHHGFNTPSGASDLLNLLHLQRSSSTLLPTTIAFDPPNTGPYDPPFHLNLPPQPSPLLRDLMFQSYNSSEVSLRGNSSSLFGEGDVNVNGGSVLYQERESGVFEFSRDHIGGCFGKGKEIKCQKSFVTEKERRVNLNDKYKVLRSLVPNPTKNDRASIVGDAIEYIKELNRTVNELKLLVEKKRIAKERIKRHKPEDSGAAIVEVEASNNTKQDPEAAINGALRSSWLQRKMKDTEVDVRIVDDEVTIKLVQRKKMNCLLSVSKMLDELQLDLRHVAGGHVGDYYSFLFNTKICEGSSVYASAIANKLIEVADRHYSGITPTSALDF